MSDLVVRPARVEEASAIAELLNGQARALHGEADLTATTVAEWFAHPELTFVVAEDADGLVCYGDLQPAQDGHAGWLDVRERPGRPGAAGPVIDELERHVPAGSARRAIVASGDESLRAQVEARGYRPIRHSFRMLAELEGEALPVEWPDGVVVRTARVGEEPDVYEAQMDAFADSWEFRCEPYERWARWAVGTERFDPSLWFLAVAADELAGICLCSRHESGDPGYAWVAVLGVRPAWRRRGLGLALLRHAFGELSRRGFERVGLGVDGENSTGAVGLYERAGMRVVRRYDMFERRD